MDQFLTDARSSNIFIMGKKIIVAGGLPESFHQTLQSVLSTGDQLILTDERQSVYELSGLLQPDEEAVVILNFDTLKNLHQSSIRALLVKYPAIKLLGLSQHWDENAILNMVDSGVMGYVSFSCDLIKVESAIEAVVDNRYYFCYCSKQEEKV